MTIQQIQQKISLKDCFDFNMLVRRGEATADEVRAAFASYVASREEIRTELMTWTVRKLDNRWHTWAKDKEGKVKEIVRNLIHNYIAPLEITLTYDLSRETPVQVAARELEKLTDEMIVAYAAKLDEKKAHIKKSMHEPETLEEFALWMKVNDDDLSKMTDDQLAQYDYLMAEKALIAAEKRWKEEAVVERVELGDDAELQIKKLVHDKRQCDIWVVRPSKRLEDEQFTNLGIKARKFGARWSSYGPPDNHGFVFYEEASAEAFCKLQNGDGSAWEQWKRAEEHRQGRAAERMEAQASNINETAEDALGRERKTHTARMARMALSAEAGAHNDIRFSSILSSIATALKLGQLRWLQRVSFGTHVDLLDELLLAARTDAVRAEQANDPSIRIEWDNLRPARLSDVRLVKWPYPTVWKSTLVEVSKLSGCMMDAKRLMKLFHDAPHLEYMQLKSEVNIQLLENLSKKVRVQRLADNLRDSLVKHKRLVAMRITSEAFLRAALREFMLHRTEIIRKVDKIKVLEYALVGGYKIPGYVPTPPALVAEMLKRATAVLGTLDGKRFIESSAGKGNIAEALRHEGAFIHCVEIDHALRNILLEKGLNVIGRDFLKESFTPESYDGAIINPPFENGQDIEHVQATYPLVRKGGVLVSIMSPQPFLAEYSRSRAFREWLDTLDYEVVDLPAGSFRDSGTNVSAKMLIICK